MLFTIDAGLSQDNVANFHNVHQWSGEIPLSLLRRRDQNRNNTDWNTNTIIRPIIISGQDNFENVNGQQCQQIYSCFHSS